ncbi:UDP-N-acetylglucosamine 1-carboxyvinyltransferase [Alienimonas sp. DA493]|uniref:UDP-N-acetylglucosamine 1-carboxyvinyltransferase n=1 Tax=Alienimonas sp. DA493 TaxID=3373605 RepID=UPI003754C54C
MDAATTATSLPWGPRGTTRSGDINRNGTLCVTGGVPLRGRVRVGGSKNAALPMLAAALLTDGPTTLRRVPDLTDTRFMLELLRELGATVESSDGTVRVDAARVRPDALPFEPSPVRVAAMRGAVCLLGPLLARCALHGGGAVRLATVGGCDLGPRPIDRHLAAFEALGANVERDQDGVTVSVDRLKGADIFLSAPPTPGLPPSPTVTGTINALCAAAVADGVSVLNGAAREPEVVAVGELLQAAGAEIEGLGTRTLIVTGVRRLRGVSGRCPAAVVPGDRIEAATWMIAAAATGGRVVVDGVDPSEVAAVAAALRDSGARVSTCGAGAHQSVRVASCGRPTAFEVRSAAFPGLPTDVLPQLAALAAVAEGTSLLTDDVFPERSAHLRRLPRFHASVERAGATAVITGGDLYGGEVHAPDLRAAAALLIAALAAEGTSRIGRASLLLRGYERPAEKLRALGATLGEPARAVGKRPARRSGRGGWRAVGPRRILRGTRPVASETPACSAAV